jgi:serine/threonine-protein kinase
LPESLLDEGAFSVRYAALDVSNDEIVCLEFLPRRALVVWSAIRQSATRLAAHGDPNVAAALGHGVAGGAWPYLITEHGAPRTLRDELAGSAGFELGRVVRIGLQCAGALAAAHGVGVIHGALAPDRVLLRAIGTHETLRITGFGLAPLIESNTDALLSSGPNLYEYCSPELADGGRLDARSDLYALGVILYELATGAAPFTGNVLSVLRQHRLAAAEPPSRRRGCQELAFRAFDKIVARCLMKDPERRYESAAELGADLGRLDAALSRRHAAPDEAPAARRSSPPAAANATGSTPPEAPTARAPRAAVLVSPARRPPAKSRVGMRKLPKVIVRGA